MLEEAMLTSIVLVVLGIFGILSRRDLLRIIISAMILLGGITILAVALSVQADPLSSGTLQSFILLAWAIEVVEVVVGIALFIRLAKMGKTDLAQMRELRW